MQELQRQLKAVIAERDALQRDVETLCLAGAPESGSMFAGPSYVLTEQLKGVSKQLLEARKALNQAEEQKELFCQELTAARAAQSALEEKLGTQKQHTVALQEEKEYFQAQVNRCLADLEGGQAELAKLRTQLSDTEVLLGKTEDHAVSEARARREAEAALSIRQQQLAQARSELEARKSEVSSISRQLSTSKDTCQKLEAALASLQAKLDSTVEELEYTRGALQTTREAEGQLRVQLQDSHALVARLEGTVSGQSEQLASVSHELSILQVSSSAELSQLRSSHAGLQQELAGAHEQVVELSQELRQARQDAQKADELLSEYRQAAHQAAAMAVITSDTEGEAAEPAEPGSSEEQQVQQARQDELDSSVARRSAVAGKLQAAGAARDAAEDAEQLAILRTMVHDLKLKLAQATQEKVEALLTMADLKQAANAVAAQASGGAGKHHHHTHSLPSGVAPGRTSAMPTSASGTLAAGLASSPTQSGAGFAAYMSSRLAASFGGLRGSGWLPGSSTPFTSGAAVSTGRGGDAAGEPGSTGRVSISGDEHVDVLTNSVAEASDDHALLAAPSSTTERLEPGGAAGRQPLAGAGLAAASVEQLVLECEDYLRSLKAAARTILASDATVAVKWSALTGLSQLHMQLNRTRARMGIPRPVNPLSDDVPQQVASTVKGKSNATPLEASITAKVLDLVDLSLTCLEQYNRREALSSVNLVS